MASRAVKNEEALKNQLTQRFNDHKQDMATDVDCITLAHPDLSLDDAEHHIMFASGSAEAVAQHVALHCNAQCIMILAIPVNSNFQYVL